MAGEGCLGDNVCIVLGFVRSNHRWLATDMHVCVCTLSQRDYQKTLNEPKALFCSTHLGMCHNCRNSV